MLVTLRRNGGEHTLVVETAEGRQHWDLSNLNDSQQTAVREMVVNDWCRRRGHSPLYPEA